MNTLLSLSTDLAAAVERASRAVAAVHARPRLASTGLVWAPGVVVTADHTVRLEEDLRVTLPDGSVAPATLAGRDPATDLAVLRAPAATGEGAGPHVATAAATAADPGSSAAPVLRVGHVVLAVGHGPRASWGVVSALGDGWRTAGGGEIDRLVGLDLTLYPGFSGGPLVDAAGRTVGIVTSGLARGLELAIPLATVARVVTALLSEGHVARGYLGVGLQPVELPEGLRRAAPEARAHGLIVVSAEAGGPAASAGVAIGDIVVALDGTPVDETEAVQALVASRPIGATVHVTLFRGGALQRLEVVIGPRPRRARR